MKKADSSDFEPSLDLACKRYFFDGNRNSIRIWEVPVMNIDSFFSWLEACQMAFRTPGCNSVGYAACLEDAILYWYNRQPQHPFWAERWRMMAETPEMAYWAEDVDRQIREKNLDPVDTIA